MRITRQVVATAIWPFLFVMTFLPSCERAVPVTKSLKGQVMYKGEGVVDARIQVQSSESGAAGSARTDANGSYQMETALPTGKYVVTVEPWTDPPPAPLPAGYAPKDNPKIPKKYRMPATSGLTWDADEGDNELDITMED